MIVLIQLREEITNLWSILLRAASKLVHDDLSEGKSREHLVGKFKEKLPEGVKDFAGEIFLDVESTAEGLKLEELQLPAILTNSVSFYEEVVRSRRGGKGIEFPVSDEKSFSPFSQVSVPACQVQTSPYFLIMT